MATFSEQRDKMRNMGFEQDGREIYEGEFNFVKELKNGNKFVFRMTHGEQLCIYYIPTKEPHHRFEPKIMLDNNVQGRIPMGEQFIKMGIDYIKKYEKVLRESNKL